MSSNHQLPLCPLRKMVHGWVWIPSYNPSLDMLLVLLCPVLIVLPPICPPCAIPSCLVMAVKFVANTQTSIELSPIHACPLSHTLSMAPSHPTSHDCPTLSSGCKI
ncbi:hypothetical protein GOBAR_AA06914 [Gossypium barbadense]|uniref:Uncharacterized protein n=1 Tax=Gossypium barbadense TaxID=3634 RepID=A0A2P5YDI2_GOSBA|nr:hypothetical protein GOBAR_AA06914 [Gossypium barbadense]